MTRSLIYLILIFALWLFFKYGHFGITTNHIGGSGTIRGGGAGRG